MHPPTHGCVHPPTTWHPPIHGLLISYHEMISNTYTWYPPTHGCVHVQILDAFLYFDASGEGFIRKVRPERIHHNHLKHLPGSLEQESYGERKRDCFEAEPADLLKRYEVSQRVIFCIIRRCCALLLWHCSHQ